MLITQDDDFEKCRVQPNFDKFDLSPQPVPPIQNDLGQRLGTLFPPITAAAPSKASQWQGMKNASASIQKRIDVLMQRDPELVALLRTYGKDYGFQVNTTSFIKAKKGASKVYQAIIEHILTQTGAVKSQTQIRRDVEKLFPTHTAPRDWTKPLPAWAVKKAKQRIQSSSAPISNVKLSKGVTLSQLHKTAAAAIERHKTGVQTFKPAIEVGDTAVVINGMAFAIAKNNVKGTTYRYVRVSMPKLLEALSSKN